jgi:hypothetical protein
MVDRHLNRIPTAGMTARRRPPADKRAAPTRAVAHREGSPRMSTTSKGIRDFQRFVVPIVGAGGSLINAAVIIYLDRVGVFTELGRVEPGLTSLATAVFVTSALATAAMLFSSRVGHNLRLFLTVVHALVIGGASMLVGELVAGPGSLGGGAAISVSLMLLGAVFVLAGIASTLIRTED